MKRRSAPGRPSARWSGRCSCQAASAPAPTAAAVRNCRRSARSRRRGRFARASAWTSTSAASAAPSAPCQTSTLKPPMLTLPGARPHEPADEHDGDQPERAGAGGREPRQHAPELDHEHADEAPAGDARARRTPTSRRARRRTTSPGRWRRRPPPAAPGSSPYPAGSRHPGSHGFKPSPANDDQRGPSSGSQTSSRPGPCPWSSSRAAAYASRARYAVASERTAWSLIGLGLVLYAGGQRRLQRRPLLGRGDRLPVPRRHAVAGAVPAVLRRDGRAWCGRATCRSTPASGSMP